MKNTFITDQNGDIHLNNLNNIISKELTNASDNNLIFDIWFFYDNENQFFVSDTWALNDINCPEDIDHIFYNQIQIIIEEIKKQFPSLNHIK